MSVKIYTAYRLKKNKDLAAFLRDAGEAANRIINSKLKELTLNVRRDTFLSVEDRRRVFSIRCNDEEFAKACHATISDCFDYLCELMRVGYITPMRNTFDPTVALRLYMAGNRWLMIPESDHIGLFGDVLSFLEADDRLEDYAYWNNTDKPDNVSTREWNRRAKIWDVSYTYPQLTKDFTDLPTVGYRDPSHDIYKDNKQLYDEDMVALEEQINYRKTHDVLYVNRPIRRIDPSRTEFLFGSKTVSLT